MSVRHLSAMGVPNWGGAGGDDGPMRVFMAAHAPSGGTSRRSHKTTIPFVPRHPPPPRSWRRRWGGRLAAVAPPVGRRGTSRHGGRFGRGGTTRPSVPSRRGRPRRSRAVAGCLPPWRDRHPRAAAPQSETGGGTANPNCGQGKVSMAFVRIDPIRAPLTLHTAILKLGSFVSKCGTVPCLPRQNRMSHQVAW